MPIDHPSPPRRRSFLAFLALLPAILVCSGACGDESVAPDDRVAPLVGDWDAVSFEVTSMADPLVSVDVIDQGADFFLNVQPSGGFTSQLSFQGASCTEVGDLSATGSSLLMEIQVTTCGGGARTDTATFTVTGDALRLQSETVFDFDLSGTSEPARLDAALQRR